MEKRKELVKGEPANVKEHGMNSRCTYLVTEYGNTVAYLKDEDESVTQALSCDDDDLQNKNTASSVKE